MFWKPPRRTAPLAFLGAILITGPGAISLPPAGASAAPAACTDWLTALPAQSFLAFKYCITTAPGYPGEKVGYVQIRNTAPIDALPSISNIPHYYVKSVKIGIVNKGGYVEHSIGWVEPQINILNGVSSKYVLNGPSGTIMQAGAEIKVWNQAANKIVSVYGYSPSLAV